MHSRGAITLKRTARVWPTAFAVRASGDRNYDVVRSLDVRSRRRLRRSGIVERPAGVPLQPPPRSAIATNAGGAIVWLAGGVLRATDAGSTRVLAVQAAGAINRVPPATGRAR